MPTQSKIVLVHGFWVTPRSWEHWIARYEARGYRVLAPAYPGFEVEAEALNRDQSSVERLTVPAIMAHLEAVVEAPPILMGHSAGGAFVQLLLDRGHGAVGVTINSAPTEGVRITPLSQLKSTFPVLKNPANRHRAVAFTYDQWRYVFTNTSTKRTRAPPTTAITSRHQGAFSGTACWRISSLGPRTSRSTTITTPAHPCSSSRGAKII
jgi:alpha-beta hydrolase superfamily lysophospholipase